MALSRYFNGIAHFKKNELTMIRTAGSLDSRVIGLQQQNKQISYGFRIAVSLASDTVSTKSLFLFLFEKN
jgi:hypothetical protein